MAGALRIAGPFRPLPLPAPMAAEPPGEPAVDEAGSALAEAYARGLARGRAEAEESRRDHVSELAERLTTALASAHAAAAVERASVVRDATELAVAAAELIAGAAPCSFPAEVVDAVRAAMDGSVEAGACRVAASPVTAALVTELLDGEAEVAVDPRMVDGEVRAEIGDARVTALRDDRRALLAEIVAASLGN